MEMKLLPYSNEMTLMDTGRALFTEMTPFYGYRNPHLKLKTVWRLYQVYNGYPYTNEMVSS